MGNVEIAETWFFFHLHDFPFPFKQETPTNVCCRSLLVLWYSVGSRRTFLFYFFKYQEQPFKFEFSIHSHSSCVLVGEKKQFLNNWNMCVSVWGLCCTATTKMTNTQHHMLLIFDVANITRAYYPAPDLAQANAEISSSASRFSCCCLVWPAKVHL